MRGSRSLYFILGALVFFVLVGAYLVASPREGSLESPRPVSTPRMIESDSKSASERHGRPTEIEVRHAQGDANRSPESVGADNKLGLANASSPYPQLAALHARGGPGDYALINWFVNECAMASQLMHDAVGRGLLNGDASVPPIPPSRGKRITIQPVVTSEVHAQRVAAAQEIDRRCGKELNAFIDPHPKDKYARLLSRWNEVERIEPSTAQLLDAHAEQGAPVTNYVLQLEIIKRHAREFSAFESEDQLQGLLELAAYAAQWNSAMPGASLRALRECVSLGRCGQKPEELDLTFYDLPPGSPQHAKAIEMIPRVRELMRL